jgi:MFS transporter, SP family, general alpha glucoside:H+ symporter
VGIINGVLVPHMVNQTTWNLGAKAAFFYGGIQVLAVIWAYFRIPETSGQTYAKLDALFSQKISARKFATTEVDPFGEIDPVATVYREKGETVEHAEAV